MTPPHSRRPQQPDPHHADPRPPKPSRLTRALRTGIESDTAYRAVVPPIYLSSTYGFANLDTRGSYDYSRSANPTRDLVADAIATLEEGAGAVVTGSGLSAITAVTLHLLRTGDEVVIPHDCYGGTWRLFDRLARAVGFRLHQVDLTDTAVATETIQRIRPRLVWLETPSNPVLRITDIAALSAVAAEVSAVCVADNTFCSPLLQRPIALGADIVVHSSTKYLNGHSDVVAGALVCAEGDLAEEIAATANAFGLTGGAFDSYLTLRGMRTLAARMRAHQENAAAVVELLNDHPWVRRVYYPGLPEHPGHKVAARQQDGFGAMVSFELADENAVRRFLDGLACFSLAESLGGTESLVSHPASMTHASLSPELQRAAGISDGLLRLSVGIEPTEDLLADLRAGLTRAEQP